MSISALPSSNLTQHLSSSSNLNRNRNMPALTLNNSSNLLPRPVIQLSVTLGAGPRWWSWCAPRRRLVIPNRGEQRCGEGQRALCEPTLQCSTRKWVVERSTCEDHLPISSDTTNRTHLGHYAVEEQLVHWSTQWMFTGCLQGGIRCSVGVCRRSATMWTCYCMLPSGT